MTTETTAPKITVTFDGIDDAEYATHLLADGMTVDELLDDLEGIARIALADAVEAAIEQEHQHPTVCAVTIEVDGEEYATSFGGDTLMDGDTAEPIRLATPAEMIASFRAGDDGYITVDGRKAYVR